MPPLCVDCQHFRTHVIGAWPFRKEFPEYGKCARADPSPVDGSARRYCSTARNEYGACGPDGKLFEAREREAA